MNVTVMSNREIAEIIVSIVDNWFGRELTEEVTTDLEGVIEDRLLDGDSAEELFSIALSAVDGHDIVPDDVHDSNVNHVDNMISNRIC